MSSEQMRMIQDLSLAIGFGFMAANSDARNVRFYIDAAVAGLNLLMFIVNAGMVVFTAVPR